MSIDDTRRVGRPATAGQREQVMPGKSIRAVHIQRIANAVDYLTDISDPTLQVRGETERDVVSDDPNPPPAETFTELSRTTNQGTIPILDQSQQQIGTITVERVTGLVMQRESDGQTETWTLNPPPFT